MGSPYMNHHMLAPRHQQITSDSLRDLTDSKPCYIKSTSRSRSVDVPYSDAKQFQNVAGRDPRNANAASPIGGGHGGQGDPYALNRVLDNQQRHAVDGGRLLESVPYRVRSSSPRYQERSSRVMAGSPHGFSNQSHGRQGGQSDPRSENMSGSPRFSNHNEGDFG